ncbi:MAG: ABC transporter permease, partial [Bdellovibrio sp.]
MEVIASWVVLATLTFCLLKILPGGPFDEDLNPVVKAQLQQQWQLDRSWWSQAGAYLSSLAQGDLGVSMVRPDRPVQEIVLQGWRNTLYLNALALAVTLVGALFLAVLALRWRQTWLESWIDQAVITCLSLPSLFWGPLLIYAFGFYWNLLPVAFLSSPVHYVLPLLTLSVRPGAALVRILKNSMCENMALD